MRVEARPRKPEFRSQETSSQKSVGGNGARRKVERRTPELDSSFICSAPKIDPFHV